MKDSDIETKKSHIVTGGSAAIYNWKMTASGLRGIHRRAVSLVSLGKGESLIDIGCGTGIMLKEIHKKSPETSLLGVDASEDMLEKARRDSPPEIVYKRAYADDLPAVSESFDMAISVLAAHHMPPEEKGRMIGEVRRVLKPNGTFLIVDLGTPRTLFGRFLSIIFRAHSYTKGNIETIEANLKEKGFKVQSRSWYWGYIEYILAKKS